MAVLLRLPVGRDGQREPEGVPNLGRDARAEVATAPTHRTHGLPSLPRARGLEPRSVHSPHIATG